MRFQTPTPISSPFQSGVIGKKPQKSGFFLGHPVHQYTSQYNSAVNKYNVKVDQQNHKTKKIDSHSNGAMV